MGFARRSARRRNIETVPGARRPPGAGQREIIPGALAGKAALDAAMIAGVQLWQAHQIAARTIRCTTRRENFLLTLGAIQLIHAVAITQIAHHLVAA